MLPLLIKRKLLMLSIPILPMSAANLLNLFLPLAILFKFICHILTQIIFFIFPTSPREIQDEIESLNANKSTGPYSIPTKLLKLLKSLLSEPLSVLFNYCTKSIKNCKSYSFLFPVYYSAML